MNLFKVLTISAATMLMSAVSFGAQTPAGTYSLDKAHTHIGFSVSHLGISNTIGRFNEFGGKVVFDPNGTSSVNFTIDAESVDTNNSRRDDHVRSDDFFDVDNFDEITFVSTAVTLNDDGDPKEIKGNLDFHGETKEVTFKVENVGNGQTKSNGQTILRAGYKATAVIDRRDFDITGFQGVVGNDIAITVNIEILKPE